MTTVRGVIRAPSRGRPGSIVVIHCGPDVTPDILPGVIRHYACAGYRFVTVQELLARGAGVRAKVDCAVHDHRQSGPSGDTRQANPSTRRATLDRAERDATRPDQRPFRPAAVSLPRTASAVASNSLSSFPLRSPRNLRMRPNDCRKNNSAAR